MTMLTTIFSVIMTNDIYFLILYCLLMFEFQYDYLYNRYGVYASEDTDQCSTQYGFVFLRHRPYYCKIADINIGILVSLTELSTHPNVCKGRVVHAAWGAIKTSNYATDFVNSNKNLLPHNKLGLILVDDCEHATVATAASLTFVSGGCANSTDGQCNKKCSSKIPTFEVFGMASSVGSSEALPAASIFRTKRLPWVESYATNDKLSDKKLYPNFFRVILPDSVRVAAMLRFFADLKWSYISIVYIDDDYAVGSFNHVVKMSKKFGICIATSHKITVKTDFDEVAKNLIDHKKARVVVSFDEPRAELFNAISKYNHQRHFIWFGSDFWKRGLWMSDPKQTAAVIGSFDVSENENYPANYIKYMRVSNLQYLRSPISQRFWKYIWNCSITNGDCKTDAYKNDNIDIRWSQLADAILTLAHAADELIKVRCPHDKGSLATKCIARHDLYHYLKQVSFQGVSTNISFDENQDVEGKLIIRQIGYNDDTGNPHYKEIGTYDAIKDSLEITKYPSWKHLKGNIPRYTSPISDFSRPCKIRQYKVIINRRCSWHCISCRENEILVNGSLCKTCSEYEIPDSQTFYTTCKSIPFKSIRSSDPISITFLLLAFIFIAFTVYIILIFNKLRNKLLFQTKILPMFTSPMVSIVLGYLTVIPFQMNPSSFNCKTSIFMFYLSFTLLYCPIVVKMTPIYLVIRTTTSNETNEAITHRISPPWKRVLICAAYSIQLLLLLTPFLLVPEGWMQIIVSESTAEYICTNTTLGLTYFVIYNMLTVIAAALVLYKCQAVAHFYPWINSYSVCIFISFFVWMCFIPNSYIILLSPSRGHRVLYSTTLIVNHTIALLSLVITKVHALNKKLPVAAQLNQANDQLFFLYRQLESLIGILTSNTEEEELQ